MTGSRTLAALALVLALIVTVFWLDRRGATSPNRMLAPGNVSRMEVARDGHTIRMVRVDDRWTVESMDDLAVRDRRANEGLVSHLLDLIRALPARPPEQQDPQEPLDPKLAGEYGMAKPSLGVTLGWDSPRSGAAVVLFGHRALGDRDAFAFFPGTPLLVRVPAHALELVAGKRLLDFRDRRWTTFDADDVEDLDVSGRCGRFRLSRDGNRWSWAPRTRASDNRADTAGTDRWLATLLTAAADEIADSSPPPAHASHSRRVCAIELTGRRGRSERITIDQIAGALWATNSALPARYRLPAQALEALDRAEQK